MTALAIYALAALTIFAILYEHVIGRRFSFDATDVVLAAIVALVWPLYLPSYLIDKALDWRRARRAAKGTR